MASGPIQGVEHEAGRRARRLVAEGAGVGGAVEAAGDRVVCQIVGPLRGGEKAARKSAPQAGQA